MRLAAFLPIVLVAFLATSDQNAKAKQVQTPETLVIPAQAGISQTIAAKAAHAQKEIPAVAGMTGYMTDSRLRGNDGESAAMGEMSPPSSFSRQWRGNLTS